MTDVHTDLMTAAAVHDFVGWVSWLLIPAGFVIGVRFRRWWLVPVPIVVAIMFIPLLTEPCDPGDECGGLLAGLAALVAVLYGLIVSAAVLVGVIVGRRRGAATSLRRRSS